ncbi:MAG: hypothetical protein K8I02_02970, partial [Candidatus Methylomirabilis sp.]|nr:hypothetical protein [Deltaproteobacteria bacterium]
MKNARKLLCLAAAAALLLPAVALAGGRLYLVAPNPPFWPDAAFPVPFNLNPGSAVGQIDGVDPAQQFIDATVAAFQTWTDVPTSRITFARGPDSADLIDATPGDGVNLMVFNSTAIVQGIPIPLPPGALAVTNTFFDFNTGEISGGAITFNTDPIPGHPNPDFSTSGAPGSIDVEAIMLHEAGHFQGLAHSNVRNDAGGDLVGGPSNAAVMFPFISPDVIDGRAPDADDIAWQGVI